MISPEFKASIAEKKLLRTRIMLKDSFVIDPTFQQLSEMLSYAKTNLPDLIVEFDGDNLEEDSSKWSHETMNEELVQLVTNFSEERIAHLKKVVSQVLSKEAETIGRKRLTQGVHSNRPAFPTTQSTRFSNGFSTSTSSKDENWKEALRKMRSEARKVNKVLYEVEENHGWNTKNINELERAAEGILKAVQEYRTNK
jgi:hypothetical protein